MHRRSFRWTSLLASGLFLLGGTSLARAQYSVTILDPPGFGDSGFFQGTLANDVRGGFQVGFGTGVATDYKAHALLWHGSANSYVDLHPAAYDASYAYGVWGNHQVGIGIHADYTTDALLWSGTAASAVSLTPTGFTQSDAAHIRGNQIVGDATGPSTGGNQHALIWYGSANNFVDLNPAGFDSSGVGGLSDTQQVGSGHPIEQSDPHANHALLWNGTAASAVDLHPAGFLTSSATATDGTHQVGWGITTDSLPYAHALLWEGTAASAIDLNPTGAFDSRAYAYANGMTIGTANDLAVIWYGSANNYLNLHQFLPSDFFASEAYAIDTNGDIVGVGETFDPDTLEIHLKALLWRPLAVPEPGSLPLLAGLGCLCLLSRSRHKKTQEGN